MDEQLFKKKLTAAMSEPSAPDALIRRTLIRVQAVRNGAAAEDRLARDGEQLSGPERKILAAQSVVGRLMQSVVPPDGVNTEMMTKQLMQKPAFQKLSDLPADRLLDDLRHGRINKMLAASAEVAQKDHGMPQAERAQQKSSGLVRK